jgi:dihydrolipoamide dehydrogenase
MADPTYDLVIIGSGPGGYVCAIRAAQVGLKTAIVEKRRTLGGTCLNIGCIPSKALLESSELYARAAHDLADHGVDFSKVSLNLEKMMYRKSKIVEELVDGVALLMKKNKVDVHHGLGVVKAPGEVVVHGDQKDTTLTTKNICLAMGSVAAELPFLPFDGDRVVASTEALSFDKVPKSLVVIGAGAVGLEMGSVWSRLGAEVTVIELLPTITPFADQQMSKALQRALEAQGMSFRLSSKVADAEVLKTKVKLQVEDSNGDSEQVDAERVLVAVGRKPCTQGSGLEDLGVELDDQGRVAVDDHFKTSIDGVYAIGDLIHGPMLAHKAEEDGIALAEQLAGGAGHVNYDLVPNVVYTEPELAMVGRTEQQLKDEGVPYSTGRYMFRPNGRAKAMGLTDGMVKILAHKDTDRILGVHMVGPRVSELIAEAVVAMEFHASAEDLARTCHAHPTLTEVVREAALAVDKRAIHG